jgi:hypothetical protein
MHRYIHLDEHEYYNSIRDNTLDNIHTILNAITDGAKTINITHFYGHTKKIGMIAKVDRIFIINKSQLGTSLANPIIDPDRDMSDISTNLVIIDAKTSLTRERVDNKLQQLLQIHDIIRNLQAGSIDIPHATEHFRRMIEEHPIHSLPSEITMIFAPNIVDSDIIDYIKSIGSGVLNIDNTRSPISESTYLQFCARFLNNYVITSNILYDITVPSTIKHTITQMTLNRMPSATDFSTFINVINESTIKSEYKQYIRNTYKPYHMLLHIFTYAVGKIGLYHNNTLDSPFGVLALSDINHRGGVRRKLLTRKK